MCATTGYSRDELLAMNAFGLLDEKGRALLRAGMDKWLKGEKPDSNVEYRKRAKDGHTFYVVLDVAYTRGVDREPLGATIIAHDIAERKKVEDRMAIAQRQTQRIIDNTTSLIYALDLENRCDATC